MTDASLNDNEKENEEVIPLYLGEINSNGNLEYILFVKHKWKNIQLTYWFNIGVLYIDDDILWCTLYS